MGDRRAIDSLHPAEAEQRQRSALVAMLRLCFAGGFFVVLVLALFAAEGPASEADRIATIGGRDLAIANDWHIKLSLAIVIAAAVALVDIYTPRKKISTLAAIFFGFIVALLATLAMGKLIDLLAQLYGLTSETSASLLVVIKVFIGVGLSYLAVVIVLETKDDFRLVVPYIEFAKQIRGVRPLVLDSSAAIDARFQDIAEIGLVQAPVIIPAFVVAELQVLADSHDKLKRAKGRRGLDAIGKLQRSAKLDVTLDETPVPGKAVDQMLVELCRSMPAVLVTTDTGLARVAGIQGVRVLNINELAGALKTAALPGEVITLRLLKAGEQPTQGVGYLEDGTMVVAEDGVERVGQEVDLTVTSSLQTSGGRLIFGRIGADADRPRPQAQQAQADPPAGNGAAAPDRTSDESPAQETAKSPKPARSPYPPKPPAETSKGRNPRR